MKKTKTKVVDFTGAVEDLKQLVKENFAGNNEIRFFISERGNRRIEIEDLDTKEIWQTLEAVNDSDLEDPSNFDDISAAIISALIQQCKD